MKFECYKIDSICSGSPFVRPSSPSVPSVTIQDADSGAKVRVHSTIESGQVARSRTRVHRY